MGLLLLALLACKDDPATPDDSVAPEDSADDSADDSGDDSGETGAPACAEDFYWDGRRCAFDWSEDYLALTEGVSTLESGNALPSALVVWGDAAFPVVLDEELRAFVAAERVGEGRRVHWGHETYLGGALSGEGDAGRLALNAVRWGAHGEASPVVGVHPDLSTLADYLSDAGLEVREVTAANLDGVDVYATMSYDELPGEEIDALAAHLAGGGGLLTAGHAWWWAYSHEEDPALAYPGNLMLPGSGLVISGETVSAGHDELSPTAPGQLVHAGYALDRMLDHIEGVAPLVFDDQVTAADTVGLAISILPLEYWDYFERALAFTEAIGHVSPSAEAPLVPAEQPIEGLAARLDDRFARGLPAGELQAHPAAEDFPGAVREDAARVSVTRTITASYEGRDARYVFSGAGADVWRSLGVYAPPGELLTLRLPASAAGQGLTALIGSHSDSLWSKDSIERFPVLTRSYALDAAETEIASAFGGLVYVRVPAGVSLGDIEVQVSGGVEAPRYVHGQTSAEDWAAQQALSAPWGELESDRIVLTLPTELLAELEDPEALMDFWVEVLDAQATLAAIDPDRVRPERIVVDRQISAGWMHSGYPIMAHLESGAAFVDLSTLRAQGDWGAFHELGHNHQWQDWELSGTTEATVNLWSVYTCEQVVGLDRGGCHSALAASTRAQRVSDYVNGGRDYAGDWSVWTALETYLELQEGFGWAPFIALNAEYQGLSGADRPADEQARLDQWVRRSSAAVERDLGPFYQAWGWPVSQATLDEVAAWPSWADDPMNP
ncbi:MAG: hypothetical protein H6741_13760 [Alphaproteobacteria bacterium]|nr:hypothetical protein [Alphaproteobacteria bacterium]